MVALTGATLGVAMDAFHTFSGTTRYLHPVLLQTASWVPALFATAYLLTAFNFVQFRRFDRAPVPRTRALIAVAVFTVVYFCTGFAPVANTGKLLICATAGVALLVWLRSRAALFGALIAMVVGPAFEIWLISVGGFVHLQPDVLGLPVWLPGIYFASGPGLGPLLGSWLAPEPAVR